jgi:hypothetical protein
MGESGVSLHHFRPFFAFLAVKLPAACEQPKKIENFCGAFHLLC